MKRSRIIAFLVAFVMIFGLISTGIHGYAAESYTCTCEENHLHTKACFVDYVDPNTIDKNKTATDLYDDRYSDVTLRVPGEADVLGSDIIYIVGSYAANEDGTPNVDGDILLSSLVSTMEEMVAAGTHVNFGMVPFSSDNVVAMPLTRIDAENIDQLPSMIANALATCEALYDGVNMENALLKAKKMFSESELADHPERQHLVMITSGFTYFFNSGENNEYAATVPVHFITSTQDSNGVFYTNKAWQRARTNQTNTYPIPKGIVEAFEAKTDKAEGETLWSFYWSYIEQWVSDDIADGDNVVYEACTIESGEFLTWYSSGSSYGNSHAFRSRGFGAYMPIDDAEELAKYPTFVAGANPLTDEAAAHAIGYERAMWEAYHYAMDEIVDCGINFYPIYNALNVNYTNGNWSPSGYGVDWTNQYIGHSFVDMLAGGEAIKYETKDDKTFFEPIKDEILYTCSIGSSVVDYIGYSDDAEDGYNFDFVDSADKLILTVGNVVYTTAKVDNTKADVTSTYTFTAPNATEPTFTLEYYQGNGTTTEHFVWTFGENVSKFAPVALQYTVDLVQRSALPGEHVAGTNQVAIIYPIDNEGNEGAPEFFPEPEVTYTNPAEAVELTLGGVKYLDDELASGFEFAIAANGEVLETVTSGEDGVFTFSALTFTEEGIYTFEIFEVYEDTDDDMIIYDETVYTVTVTVTLSEDGTLLNVVTEGAEGIEFFNETETIIPDEPVPENPPTGDGIHTAFFAAIASLMLLGTCIVLKRKEC